MRSIDLLPFSFSLPAFACIYYSMWAEMILCFAFMLMGVIVIGVKEAYYEGLN